MAEIERNIFFYEARVEEPEEWKRADVLRQLQALRGDDLLMSLRDGDYV